MNVRTINNGHALCLVKCQYVLFSFSDGAFVRFACLNLCYVSVELNKRVFVLAYALDNSWKGHFATRNVCLVPRVMCFNQKL